MVFLALLVAGVPLWRMTHASAPPPSAAAAATTSETQSQVHLAVAFAQKPASFEVDYLGKPLWQMRNVQTTTAEKTIAMVYPKEGVDIEYKVTWPPGTPLTAAKLSVAANEAEPPEKTLWGAGSVDDVLTFP